VKTELKNGWQVIEKEVQRAAHDMTPPPPPPPRLLLLPAAAAAALAA
jgi:hypothetical protein